MTRIVIVSHSHPALRYGGGEVAAYRQFQHLLAQDEDAWFVGSTIGPEGAARFFGPGQRVLRPEAQMICTLHEMTAICANHGQMLKTSGELCHAASDVACAACLNRPPVDFALRRARMAEMLDLFDVLLSPSRFLAERFEGWGIPPGRISVIENGLDHLDPRPETTPESLLHRSRRFAFFGQATPTKGLNVLVRAAELIEAAPPANPVTLEVYGVTAEAFAALWPGLKPPAWMQFRGRYRPQDCVSIMGRFGWIIIPSIWWENSPVVIQEARAAGTPMIASDIGGMAEKTEGWGIQFPVGDPAALAATILSVHDRPEILAQHIARIEPPLDMAGFHDAWTKIRA